jgi:hypothetical protein
MAVGDISGRQRRRAIFNLARTDYESALACATTSPFSRSPMTQDLDQPTGKLRLRSTGFGLALTGHRDLLAFPL